MASTFNLRALITAVDRLSPVLRAQMRVMGQWRRTMEAMGSGGIPMAAGMGAALAVPTKAFMDAEAASISLKNALMTKNGLSGGFEQLNKIAVQLGNKLPGTTADFVTMASVMKANNVIANTMVNGGLQNAAYLAVATQGLGESYESAALGMAKIANIFKIADKDFNTLADTMQRVVYMGVGIEPFTEAMSKAGAALAGVKQQGIGVAKSIAPLVAVLVQSGIDASDAGTGLNSIINDFAKAGRFTTIENMVKDLKKVYKLDSPKLISYMEKMFGKEHGKKAIVIARPGSGSYTELVKIMENEANLNQRTDEMLKSMKSLIDSAEGTITNAMAVIGQAYAPEIKQLADQINNFAGSLIDWAEKNGDTIKIAIKMAASFVGLKLGFLAAAAGLKVLMGVMRLSFVGILIRTLAFLGPWIYKHWGDITEFMKKAWDVVINWIDEKFQKFINGLLMGVNAIRGMFNFGDIKIDLPKLANSTLWEDVRHYFDEGNNAGLHGMRSPSHTHKRGEPQMSPVMPHGGAVQMSPIIPNNFVPRPSFLQPVALRGAIDVNFHNAPAGMRVEQKAASSGLKIRQNVGFRTLGTA